MIDSTLSLLRLLKGYRRLLFVSGALALLQSALLVPIGLLVRHVMDTQAPAHDTAGIAMTGGVVILLAAASAALALVARHLALKSTKEAIRELRMSLVERLQRVQLAWFDDVDDDVVHATIVQDTERLDTMGAAVAAQLLPAAVISAALVAALVVVAPMLFLVLLCAVPFVVLAIRVPTVAIRRLSRDYQEAFDRYSARMAFAIRASLLVRSDGGESRETLAAAADTALVAETGRRLFWTHFASAQLSGFTTTVAGTVVLVLGGIQLARGHLTSGTLVAFYALILPLRGQLSTILMAAPQIVSGRQSLHRLETLLPDDQPRVYAGTGRLDFRGDISLDDVSFAYRPGVPVLAGVSLSVTSGEVVGLAGPNGAGKSTLAAIVLGLRRPDRGCVYAGGTPYDDVDVEALRRRMALLPQHPLLFPGSVEDNIAYASGATEADVRRAAGLAAADEVVARLDGGYAARVGEHGKLLAGGEEQRIAIARALVRQPALLILDEPTTHLDAAATHKLLQGIRSLPWHPAVLVISHDEQVLEAADRIYDVRHGRVTERQPSLS